MRFLVRKRRSTPTVIIVALIDVLVVLVIFLMVTTTFRQQPALKVALPESSQSQKSGADENPPLMVSIEANTNGVFRYGPGGEPLTTDQLRKRLTADVQKLRQNKQEVRLALRADKSAPWFKVVFVMDLARELRIQGLSALTKEQGKP
jgi:biopolymer transport protein ExbD